jgi:hypothetical protein
MSPEQELRVDNLLGEVRELMTGVESDRAQRALLASRLERIERALALPLNYSLAETCSRLGMSVSTGRKHPERLPTPTSFLPLRYLVADVEALASKPREERGGRRAS